MIKYEYRLVKAEEVNTLGKQGFRFVQTVQASDDFGFLMEKQINEIDYLMEMTNEKTI
jgi:hypothetical protein